MDSMMAQSRKRQQPDPTGTVRMHEQCLCSRCFWLDVAVDTPNIARELGGGNFWQSSYRAPRNSHRRRMGVCGYDS
jgi:hypothetical protein